MAEPVTIAALGDSLTQGYGLPVEDGLVPRLSAWLTEAGAEVEVINAGVSGDTTAGGLARVGWTLAPEVDALLVALGGNDVLRGLPPEMARENLSGILTVAEEAGVPAMLIGITIPGNFGPGYQAEFAAIYPELAAEFSVPLYPDMFGVFDGEDAATARALWFQPDGLHPNAAGVEKIVEDLGPAVLSFIEGL